MQLHKKFLKKVLKYALVFFILINIIAIFHAYKFTHFGNANLVKTKNPETISKTERVKTLLFGVTNPRPTNKTKPSKAFETITLQSNKKIECWYTKATKNVDSNKGTVIILHGYSGEKSMQLDKAAIFDSLHYNCLLVDFMGSGGSEGNATTIGFKEAEQVKTAIQYLQNIGEQKIYLFGTSMGAAAILKCLHDNSTLKVQAIILECPFGSMYKTVAARFNNMHVPAFPMAHLLVFWGGVLNNFWAFEHNPTQYASKINCPTLLLYGNKDKNVSLQETNDIFENLKGQKQKVIFKNTGHENYLLKNKTAWIKEVDAFLQKY